MASPEHSDEIAQLHRLLISAVLGDADESERESLNALLASDIELCHEASRFLEEEAVLRQQFNVLRRVEEFHAAEGLCVLPRCAPRDRSRNARKSPLLRYLGWYVVAASVLAAAMWTFAVNRTSPIAIAPVPKVEHHDGGDAQAVAPLLAVLPPLEKISWAGPQFALRHDTSVAAFRVQTGVIPFGVAQARQAEGYMLQLPPGAVLDMVVTAEAHAENALAVTEFDEQGRPVGHKISFSNSASEQTGLASEDSNRPPQVRLGPLGVYREHNDSERSRYYLLTCVHKPLEQSAVDAWRISQLSVMLRDENFLHIGWDDGGMIRASDGAQIPDQDFNDLSASIRIHRPQQSGSASTALRVLWDTTSTATAPPVSIGPDRNGVPFDVAPGQVVVLKLSNRAWVPLALSVVDDATGEIQWQCSHLEPRFTNVGICALENSTQQTRSLRLVCRYLSPEPSPRAQWRTSEHEVLFQQDAFITVGFENGTLDGSTEHVKVDLITMDRL